MMIAWVRSSVMVARKVTRKVTMPVLKRWLNMKRMACHSFMRTAVTMSTPASALMGMSEMTGARSRAEASRARAWMIETNRVWPPDLMPTERAGDGRGGGNAAEEGDDDVADALGDQLLVGLQADAGHLAADGAAQAAIRPRPVRQSTAAGTIRPLMLPHGIASSVRRWSSRIVRGMAPMLATGQPVTTATNVATMMPTSEPGT